MSFFRRNSKPSKQRTSAAAPKSKITDVCSYCDSEMEPVDRWCPACGRDSRWDEEEELDNW
ncbi:MAG TPA: hypothetical protein QF762_02255 [Acidimicrobiales bacterium]|nr:hypothetical protein [Acidimicrobiales bacterium]